VARHNGFAQTGIDVDFGKGETELNRFNGDDAHQPNPCIGPIETAPYYGLEIWPAEIAVSTGLSTDANARVLNQDGQAIPGLYACGNDMASIMCGSSRAGHHAGPRHGFRLSGRDACCRQAAAGGRDQKRL
jgi:succinate dehydrogenase/fumarate reductase flavoprotein subunit